MSANVIIYYQAGNLTSVARALEHLGHRSEITDRPEKIRAADRVILPGVGAAGATMENLRALGLAEVLRNDVARAGKPFLGICIGIQVLLDHSADPAFQPAQLPGVFLPGRSFDLIGVLQPVSAGVWRLKPRSAADLKKL
jgi:imidazole glycerol phosphate synthase glutamine amidotransferase subunit